MLQELSTLKEARDLPQRVAHMARGQCKVNVCMYITSDFIKCALSWPLS